MPLQSSGQIGAGNIRTEFNQTGEVTISDYYRNGSLVDFDQTSVPTSGEISFSNFYEVDEPASGTSATFYDVNDYYFYVQAIDPGVYEVTVMWNGVVATNTTVNDTTLPTQVTANGYTYKRSGSNQGSNKFTVYRVVP
jgi:hypothetical protein